MKIRVKTERSTKRKEGTREEYEEESVGCASEKFQALLSNTNKSRAY